MIENDHGNPPLRHPGRNPPSMQRNRGPITDVLARVDGKELEPDALLRTLGERIDLSRLTAKQRALRGPALARELIRRYARWQVERAFDRCVDALLAVVVYCMFRTGYRLKS